MVGRQRWGVRRIDGDGIRRKRVEANGTIHYLDGYERNLGGVDSAAIDVVTKYYSASLGTSSTLFYVGTDHLGGTIRVTDSTSTAKHQMRRYALGGSRCAGASPKTDHLYTGQIQDASTSTIDGSSASIRTAQSQVRFQIRIPEFSPVNVTSTPSRVMIDSDPSIGYQAVHIDYCFLVRPARVPENLEPAIAIIEAQNIDGEMATGEAGCGLPISS